MDRMHVGLFRRFLILAILATLFVFLGVELGFCALREPGIMDDIYGVPISYAIIITLVVGVIAYKILDEKMNDPFYGILLLVFCIGLFIFLGSNFNFPDLTQIR